MKNKKKKRSLQTYSLGTSKNGVVKIYNETPQEALAENDIAKAKAKYEAESNPWTMALTMLGNMGVQYGSSMMGSYGGAMSGAMQGGSALASMENGGEVGSETVEVEGEEVAEMPNGEMTEFKGPKHEQGGIKVTLPEGTKIFSDKLKVKGKSLADRKKAREGKMNNLLKRLDENPTDKILKQTIERTQESNQMEELADFQLQEFANILDGLQTFAYGTAKEGLKKMDNGGTIGDPRPYFSKGYDNTMYNDYIANYMLKNPDFNIDDEASRKALQKEVGVTQDGIFGPKTFEALQSKYPMQSVNELEPKGTVGTKMEISNPDLTIDLKNKMADTAKGADGNVVDINKTGNNNPGFTAGDATGMIGTAISVIGPYLQTLKNRAEDTPNINAYKNFGEDALETNEETQGYIAGQRDNAITRILRNRNATVARNRNSARGVNTMRALDLTADQNVNRAMSDIYDAFSRQMIGILSEKAGLENVQDQMVMSGEEKRDIADRMDKDNYRTQLAQNWANIGAGVQKIGQDINQSKENQDFMDILPDLSQYGLGYVYDENGNLTIEKVQ